MGKSHKNRSNGNRGWNDKNTLKIKSIGDRAGAYVWLTNQTADVYESRMNNSDLVIMIITYLIGSSGIAPLIATDNVYIIKWINGIIMAITIIVGIAKTIQRSLNYQKNIKKHGWASAQYTALFLDIQKVLQDPIPQRPRFNKFYLNIQKKEINLRQKTPYIPENIVSIYYNKMGNAALKPEILFGDVHTIEVCVDTDTPIAADIKPTSSEIDENIEKSTFERHRSYSSAFRKSKRNLKQSDPDVDSESNSDSDSESILTGSELQKAKRISEKKRYELERYFIDGSMLDVRAIQNH